jgi:hypothetical protein
MAIENDIKIIDDKRIMDQWRKQFIAILSDVDNIIDEITETRWGALAKFATHINLGKDKLESMKLLYPTEAAEIDTWITYVDNQISIRQARYTGEVYDKING